MARKYRKKNRRRRGKKRGYTREVGYRRHTAKRAMQKYNIFYTDELRGKLLRQIKGQKSLRATKLTHSRSLHEVTVEGGTYYLIYSRTTKEIVTLLEKGHAQRLFDEKNTSPRPEGGRPKGG